MFTIKNIIVKFNPGKGREGKRELAYFFHMFQETSDTIIIAIKNNEG